MSDDNDDRLESHLQTNRQGPDSRGIYTNPGQQGVTVTWLAQAFRMNLNTVKSKLGACPPKSIKARGTKMTTTLYDLATAASFLVRPTFTSEEYMRALRSNDLPPALQVSVWDALLKRQKFEENAGELWRTEKVREVLGSTFQTIRFQVQLWAETVERQTELSKAQRDLIVEMADMLLQDIYAALVDNTKTETGSQLDEIPELVGEAVTLKEAADHIEDPDDFGAVV